VVELLGGLHQADVAFLDEVGERDAAVRVLLGDADHEAEVAVDQGGFGQIGVGPAHVDATGDLDLVLPREQRDLAHRLQILVQKDVAVADRGHGTAGGGRKAHEGSSGRTRNGCRLNSVQAACQHDAAMRVGDCHGVSKVVTRPTS
jgi:hypothetical protein